MIAATVVSISEGGFAVETTAQAEQGEPVRLRFQAQGAVPEFEVEALVWYGHAVARSSGGQRRLGCVLPARSPEFIELFGELERRNAPPERRTRAARPVSPRRHAEETDLPRSRDPLPPPKPEPEETLPAFRIRLRQIGGPRTRIVSVQACSISQAAERARSELAASGLDADGWAVLEVKPIADDPARRKA